MRRWMKPALVSLALACVTLGATGTASAQPERIPALRPEGARPPPPGPNHLWEPGHWRWEHGRYVWIQGRYVMRRPEWRRGHFVRGHWQRRRGEWVWVRGHWD